MVIVLDVVLRTGAGTRRRGWGITTGGGVRKVLAAEPLESLKLLARVLIGLSTSEVIVESLT